LVSENEEMMFVTLFYGVLNPATGRFVYATGGHNPPVLRAGNEVRLLESRGGMALAIVEQATFLSGQLDLEPGNVLFLYTDGITEAQNPLETLARIEPDAPADAYPTEVVKAVQKYMAGAPQADDITCVTLRYAGQKQPASSCGSPAPMAA
jgi:sigma-B regulation protein RsbU (phosphoserine phosphatase)